MGISKLMVNKCMSSMLIPSMYMFPIIVHAEKIEEQKLKQVGKELKRTRVEDGNSSKLDLRFNIRQGSKRGFLTKVLLTLQGPTRVKCLPLSRKRENRDFPMLKGQGRENSQAQESAPNSNAPMMNRSILSNPENGIGETYLQKSASFHVLKLVISKGFLYHIVRVKNVESESPPLELVPAVKDFLEVFRNALPGTPPKRERDFDIYLLPDTQPIPIPPYQIGSTKLKNKRLNSRIF
ncbi:hypothetical protein EJD97_020521 [Solanum chilense]|uniref:Uncharacterized protein n=1 Tax=Solanum chilense TaxID=4083 RepID=A0A6N2CHV3_SOLCI|nr:hypothetical protein EJD97_020521 [Solanum chilense]